MQWIGPLEHLSQPHGVAVQIPGLEGVGPVEVRRALPPMTRARLEAFLGHPHWARVFLETPGWSPKQPPWTNFSTIRRGLELGRFPPDCSFEVLHCDSLPKMATDFYHQSTELPGVMIQPTRAAPCPWFGPGPLEPLTSDEGRTLVPGLRRGLQLSTLSRMYGAMTFEALEALLTKPGEAFAPGRGPYEDSVRNLEFMREHRLSEFVGCLFELHGVASDDPHFSYNYGSVAIWPVRGPAAEGPAAEGPAAEGPAAGPAQWARILATPQGRQQKLAGYPRHEWMGPVSEAVPAPGRPSPADPPSREQVLGDRFLEAAATGDLEGLAAVAPEFLAAPRPGRLIYFHSHGDVRCCRRLEGDAETHAQAVGQALRLALHAGHEAEAQLLLRLPVELGHAELSAALAAAAGLGQAGLVKALLEDPRTPGDPGTARAAFENAALSGRTEAARLLAGRAKWTDREKSHSFAEKLMRAAIPSELLDLAAAELLPRLPAELGAAELSEALAAAAGLGQAGYVRALLEDPRSIDDSGAVWAAFESAVLSGRTEAARLLAGHASMAKSKVKRWVWREFSTKLVKLEEGAAISSELLDLAVGVLWGKE